MLNEKLAVRPLVFAVCLRTHAGMRQPWLCFVRAVVLRGRRVEGVIVVSAASLPCCRRSPKEAALLVEPVPVQP